MSPDFRARIEAARNVENMLAILPSVVTYARLEPLSLTRGDLAPGLRMPLADPLWMLGRQWQFGELHGEDAGTPVMATVEAEHAQADRLLPRGSAAVDLAASGLPVEPAVEAEAPEVLPERVRAHTGMQLLRRVTAAVPHGLRAQLRSTLLGAYGFATAAAGAEDPMGTDRRTMMAGRVPDGSAALAALSPLPAAGLPEVFAEVPATHHEAVRAALTEWAHWAAGYVTAPLGNSWDPHRQEYSFALKASLPSGEVTLDAGEYFDGTVDWHTFDASQAGPPGDAGSRWSETAIPTPVRYPGMPADRLWAFEDGKVYVGGLDAGPTDLARLALIEFSLAYGNDWFLMPFDLPYGAVAKVTKLTVKDTFGVTVQIPASRDAGRPGWTVFQHTAPGDTSALADLFVLPATLRHVLEGPALEEVAYFRDELANLVWGVERIVQGPSGEPVRLARMAPKVSLRQQIPGDIGDARIIYRLMTAVPENWIPFVSVPLGGLPLGSFATELQRRPLLRFRDDGTTEVINPRGVLMRPPGEQFLRLAAEEVPREGIVVTRSFQSARTADGRTVLWIGRRKRVGTGEGSSGWRFDTALPA